jgi:hypothetical protein
VVHSVIFIHTGNVDPKCERIIEKDWEKVVGNLSFHDIPPVIISLAESDNESMSSQNLSSDDASTSSIKVACNEEDQHMFKDTSNDEIIIIEVDDY